MTNPLAFDLEQTLATMEPVWRELRGASVFITGGTGFFGRWLLESLVWANDYGDARVSATILSRDPAAFAKRAPALAGHHRLTITAGDVRSFNFPIGVFPFVIHAAADASALDDHESVRDIIVSGAKRVFDFSRACGAHRLLHISSGAVYGRLTAEIPHASEDMTTDTREGEAPDGYRDGKREAERLVLEHSGNATIARCFAFHGPHLPMSAHFAIGNFLADRQAGRTVQVKGDGRPLRSYLYAADLAVWLWTILARGERGRAYNVGSEKAISIGDLARMIAEGFEPRLAMDVRQAPGSDVVTSYVPSTQRARTELGLCETVLLQDGIARTLKWLERERVAE